MILSRVFIYSMKNGRINRVLEPGKETLTKLFAMYLLVKDMALVMLRRVKSGKHFG